MIQRALPWVGAVIAAVVLFLLYSWNPGPPPQTTVFGELEPGPENLEPAPAPLPRLQPLPTVKQGAYERAQETVAEALGRGRIRCDVGPDVPSGPVEGDFEGRVENGILRALVRTVEGSSGVHGPGPMLGLGSADLEQALEERLVPLATIQWRGAAPGRLGDCTVIPTRSVPLSGTVTMDGEPAPGVTIAGCGVPTATDADGVFQLTAWAGVPCTLTAVRQQGTRVRDGGALDLWPELPGVDGLRFELGGEHGAYEEALQRRQRAQDELPDALLELEALEALELERLPKDEELLLERRLRQAKLKARRLQRVAESEFTPQDFPDRFVPFGALPPSD